MQRFFHGSIAFQLWLALSLVAMAFTALSVSVDAWQTVEDDIQDARVEARAKVEAMLATAGSILTDDPVLSFKETASGERLGIVAIDFIDSSGSISSRTRFTNERLTGPPLGLLDPDATPYSVSLRFKDGRFVPSTMSPFDVISGGSFGEAYIAPLDSVIPGQEGYIRTIVRYPDLAGDARDVVTQSIGAALMIISAILIGTALLLNFFVSQPLRRYSRLAMRIALGEPVRMPAASSSELAELARALNSMADALEYDATVDKLTGLFNLRHLSSSLEKLIAEAAVTRSPLCVIVGDLDNLKPINDNHGHQAGDQILRAVGSGLKAWAGNDFTCWRLGGDEFVVALPNIDAAEGKARGNELRQVVASIAVRVPGAHLTPSISVGVAVYPEDGDNAGALLGIADRRMYVAKATHSEERNLETASVVSKPVLSKSLTEEVGRSLESFG